ncbi:MAG: thiamine diphosphokinase [Lachnospiraceae bacterium]|nr:thiamine diphosphokinase [Lachnospiraceae bacterium]
MAQKQCVIIGGAEIKNYDRVRSYLEKDYFYIFCDSGLKHREPLCLIPDLIVGDFDSWENPCLNAETITLPREKDDTDTVYAIKEAIRRGFETFLLIGAAGERLDHTLVNVYALLMLDSAGKKARLVDDYSEMEIVSKNTAFISNYFPYFSLLNISGTARGITIENAKFPLRDGEITSEYQYATSNEVLPGQTAQVTVKEGRLLLIKCFP